ncbi:MAG: hypothetical protein M0023_12290 [Desulfobacteraceae bacterium]|nr:hypothetical protein [Desulfobacteraceae bacterium]
MKKYLVTIAALLTVGLIAGCGGSGSTPASSAAVSGKVADGYLVGATVFMDKNNNYQLDAGEPHTTTDANGAYTLMNVDPADVGKYPIVAMAIKGQTTDLETGPVSDSYVLSMPAAAVFGTHSSNFISPMSTLIREKMSPIPNRPAMTLTEAMAQLRNQMNLPAGIDMMADYVAGSQPGTMNATQYQTMHVNAQKMAGLMAGQAGLVMPGNVMNLNRYRGMMGTINSNMPAIAVNAISSTFMTGMMTQMQAQLGAMPMTGFTNYSGLFRNMTSNRYFWNTTGGTTTPTTPMSGGMM